MPASVQKILVSEEPIVIIPMGMTRLAGGIINDSHRWLFLTYGLGSSKKRISLAVAPGQSGSILQGWREGVTGFWGPLKNHPAHSFFFGEEEPEGAFITDLKGRIG